MGWGPYGWITALQCPNLLPTSCCSRFAYLHSHADSHAGSIIKTFHCILGAVGWTAVGPPHKQRYLRYTGAPQQPATSAEDNSTDTSTAARAGGLLACVKADLFESGTFARLLKSMLDVEILKHAGEVRRFRAGTCDHPIAVQPALKQTGALHAPAPGLLHASQRRVSVRAEPRLLLLTLLLLLLLW